MKNYYIITGLFFIISLNITNAQVTARKSTFSTKGNGSDSVQYVTVGSIMPYKITPFRWGTLSRFMNPSVFMWWLNGNATGYKLLKIDGKNTLTPLPPPEQVYFNDSAIAIQWVKTGNYTIRVSEKSRPKAGFGGCDQSPSFQSLDVVVAPRPTVSWNGATTRGGCNLANTVQDISVSGTGFKSVSIAYDLIYTPREGKADTTSKEITFPIAKNQETFNETIQVPIDAGKYGTYEVKIKTVTDKVSYLSGIDSLPDDIPDIPFTLIVLPDPETGPIEFIQTLN